MATTDRRRDRITVPVDDGRMPGATVAVATGIARQCGLGLEFVAVAGRSRADPMLRLRHHCALAGAAGVDHPTWALLDGGDTDIGTYATWSGTLAVCVAAGTRRSPTLPRCGVPLLVVGPRAGPTPAIVHRVVAGLDGSVAGADVASAAARVALRLDVELELTEVVAPRWTSGDVHESAYLHGVAATLDRRPRSFDILRDDRPAAGLLRFVGGDGSTVIAVGMPAHWHARGVAEAVVRCAPCPVLLVPRRQLVTNPS